MSKFSPRCTDQPVGPFTFWAAQPVLGGGGDCACVDGGDADWLPAGPDERHGNSHESWLVGQRASFSTEQFVRGLVLNMLLTDAAAVSRQSCAVGGRRGWWFDDWRTDGFRLGSRLWTLQWEATTQETLVRAREYALDALQWLVRMKVADTVDVKARYVGMSTIVLDVIVWGPWGASDLTLRGIERPPYGFLWREDAADD